MKAAKIEAFLAEYEKKVEEEAAKTLEETAGDLPEPLFEEYEKEGSRLGYEKIYFARRRLLAVRGLAVILNAEQKRQVPAALLKKLEEIIDIVCKEECWAVPAHVDRAGNKNWRNTADLFACETAQTLSEIADRAEGMLDGRVQSLIRKQVEERVLRPFFTSKAPYTWWETAENNWNAVCSGAIGSACLHLFKKEPELLKERLPRVTAALEHYLAGFAEDGACMEGIGYYTYGMTYFSNFAQELYEYTGGKTDLFWESRAGFDRISEGTAVEQYQKDKRYRIASFMGKCFFPDGKTVRFSDACEKDSYRLGLYSVLALHYPALEAPDCKSAAGLHTDTCYRFAGLKLDLLYTRKYLEFLKGQDAREEEEIRKGGETRMLPQAQWWIATSDSGVGFACKGGDNGEPHNHNDVGSFHYEADGELFLTDLGAGEYTRDYFGEGRYRILCNHSFGHSVPIVNGRGQGTGEEYRCTAFEEKQDQTIRMEFAKAYPDSSLKYLERRFQFDRGSGELLIVDEAEFWQKEKAPVLPDERPEGWGKSPSQNSGLVENLITQIPPKVQENRIVLQGKKRTCVIRISAAEKEEICIKECVHKNHEGIEEKVFAILWPVTEDGGKYGCAMRIHCFDNERNQFI